MTNPTTQATADILAITEHEPHPLDALVPDPAGLSPLCDAEAFAASLEGMVADFAPRVFAVVQEYGERVDGRIAAWGMAFEDHAEIVDVKGRVRMGMRSPEDALRGFAFGSHVRPHLVWVNPDAATRTKDDESD
ncbi:MAG TPA: hypothetical protein VGD84_07580 [Pseudonocardiaceae bacterium]